MRKCVSENLSLMTTKCFFCHVDYYLICIWKNWNANPSKPNYWRILRRVKSLKKLKNKDLSQHDYLALSSTYLQHSVVLWLLPFESKWSNAQFDPYTIMILSAPPVFVKWCKFLIKWVIVALLTWIKWFSKVNVRIQSYWTPSLPDGVHSNRPC